MYKKKHDVTVGADGVGNKDFDIIFHERTGQDVTVYFDSGNPFNALSSYSFMVSANEDYQPLTVVATARATYSYRTDPDVSDDPSNKAGNWKIKGGNSTIQIQ
jgi:hypothetical protein